MKCDSRSQNLVTGPCDQLSCEFHSSDTNLSWPVTDTRCSANGAVRCGQRCVTHDTAGRIKTLIYDINVTATQTETNKWQRWEGQAVDHMHCSHSRFVVSTIVVSVAASQESSRDDDVTKSVWHAGRQLPHLWVVPHFCTSLWRRCHLSGNLSDSWEWNGVRNQSHILSGNVSVVPICRMRSATSPTSPLITLFPVVLCRMGPSPCQMKCYYWVQRNTKTKHTEVITCG